METLPISYYYKYKVVEQLSNKFNDGRREIENIA